MSHRRGLHSFFLLIVAVSAIALLSGCGPSTDTTAKEGASRNPALKGSEREAPAKEADREAAEKTNESDSENGQAATPAADGEPKQTVKIVRSAFEPADITIKAGTTVVWLNTEPAEHKVHDDNDAYLSEAVGKDGTFEMTYSAPGTFAYHCHVHPMMRGTITVE